MTGYETPSSACTRRPDEIGADGFSSSSWPEPFPAVQGGGGGGGGGDGGVFREEGSGGQELDSIGYPRMSAIGESSTTMHGLLHASGSHPISPPNDPKPDEIGADGFSSSSWPEPFPAVQGGGGGGGGGDGGVFREEGSGGQELGLGFVC
ncbi:hypothetical protein F511_36453 [Dorcoceras hygrometricum]|uniref:Uncharacterized protein n=1 Tax=Dorcoceras hygrometricum TaxID=472368 RepID=A0A2Z7BAH3_9LAMI|nr:hypothetical protein F511_36453 [Dorcoceras hygrometricum]